VGQEFLNAPHGGSTRTFAPFTFGRFIVQKRRGNLRDRQQWRLARLRVLSGYRGILDGFAFRKKVRDSEAG
jgi:hypothetical protein